MDPKLELAAALHRLRSAADVADRGIVPDAEWAVCDGPAVAGLRSRVALFQQRPAFTLDGLRLAAGAAVQFRTELRIPARLAGVPLADEPVLATLHTIYPASLQAHGVEVFTDSRPVVAGGPADFQLVAAANPGEPVPVQLAIYPPEQQVHSDWVWLHLTTPKLHRRFVDLDLAWARLALAAGYATSPADEAAVLGAARCVPDDPLAAPAGQLADSLQRLADALAPLADRIERVRVHAVGHSHIDLQWLWTWADARNVILRDARNTVELLDEFPRATFTHSQPAGYEVIRKADPALFVRIAELVAAGRWEPATCQWVEADANLPAGEAHVRQLAHAVRWTQKHLGVAPQVLLAPDTFGHSGNLPQLARSAGARVYYHHRANPGQVAGGEPWPAYWWQGLDGSRILAVSTDSYLGEISAGRVARDALRYAHPHGLSDVLLFYGVGNHGGGPTRRSLRLLDEIASAPGLPGIACSTVLGYAAAVLASGVELPEHTGESATVFEGCYTSHADAKRANRDGENLLLTAETVAVLADQPTMAADLPGAWRALLFHQFHDIIDGSAIKEAYDLTAADAGRIRASATSVIERGLAELHAGLPAGAIAITNPLGWDRQDVVEVDGITGPGSVWLRAADGSRTVGQVSAGRLHFLADVPAFATRCYTIDGPAHGIAPVGIDGFDPPGRPPGLYRQVETRQLRALLRTDCGVVTSLFDKRSGRELVGYGTGRAHGLEQVRPDLGLGVLQLLAEQPHHMSSWVIDDVYSEQSLLRGAEVELVEHGPVRAAFRVRQRCASSQLDRTLIFYADLPRIDLHFDVEWGEQGSSESGVRNLAVAFTTRQADCEAWFEAPYAAVCRPADGLPGPALRWAAVGGPQMGLAVLNDGKYGHESLGTRLRVHLLRSSYNPDLQADLGARDHTRLAVLPYVGDWRAAGIVPAAAGFNQPLLARRVASSTTGPAAGCRQPHPWLADPGSAMITAYKFAEESRAVVLRLQETHGVPTCVRLAGLPAGARIWLATVTEQPLRSLAAANGSLTLALRRFEVVTLVIEAG